MIRYNAQLSSLKGDIFHISGITNTALLAVALGIPLESFMLTLSRDLNLAIRNTLSDFYEEA